MAEVAGPSVQNVQQNSPSSEDNAENYEPETKKTKLCISSAPQEYKLEERLNGILCCTVCLDLPTVAVYQCVNGHLMCAGCFAHLLADARLKDETATCPNCRCEISKTSCSRNLAVEKAISELPAECQYCSKQLPRSGLEYHEHSQCQERRVQCKYERIGCPWSGPFHEVLAHEFSCCHPKKSGEEVMVAIQGIDQKREVELLLYQSIFNLLSFEKIAFSDLQLRPYRTDDFITKLFYETSRFSAFNLQWVARARVNDNLKNPAHTTRRSMTYQLVLKSKVSNPINIHYVALKGPYGEMKINPCIYEHEFSNDNQEVTYKELPIADSGECNKLLAGKTINMRLIMFQVQT